MKTRLRRVITCDTQIVCVGVSFDVVVVYQFARFGRTSHQVIPYSSGTNCDPARQRSRLPLASGSLPGDVQVRGATVSNAMPFTVLVPSITNVTPASAASGTSVTITGSHFGATQGAGQVWLGTAAGVVTTWSDTQVVATIAEGSQTGQAQRLQHGVASNTVALTVAGGAPDIQSIWPSQGAPGAVVTLYGSGFGASRGTGEVLLGNAPPIVNAWTDTQVT